MMKYVYALFLIVLCQGSYTPLYAQEKKYPPEIEQKIREVENNLGFWIKIDGEPNLTLKDRMSFYHVKGVSVAVIKNYKIEWVRGYGWADSLAQRRVTPGTLFQAGSISKSLNGVGILKLVQNKKLDLYSDVNDYLTSWKFPYDSLSKGKKVTLANLLSHTAGLTVHGFPGYERGDTIPTLIQILNGDKPANTPAVRSAIQPGLKHKYSGGGTTISQLIIQDLTNEPYDVFMRKNVLEPMGMKNSSYTQPPQGGKQQLLASGYYKDGKEVKGKYHIYPEQAAAGLWTNPTDLAHYIIETQLALTGKSHKVLSQEMTKLRLTPYVDNSAAMGVFIIKRGEQTYFQHSGADEGFVAQYYGSMEGGNGVVVMVNSDNGAITEEIVNSVATVYGWKGFYNPIQRPKIISVPQNILEMYVGEYKRKVDDKFYLKMSLMNGKLIYSEPDWDGFELFAGAENDFFSRENPVGITFNKNTAGKVIELVYHSGSRNEKFIKVN
jgi:CubicO group peptidase (beta-lactamase class C family)